MDELIAKLRQESDKLHGVIPYYRAEAIVRTHQQTRDVESVLTRASDILTNLKPEGERTKYDELEAAYAILFKQLVEVTSKQPDVEAGARAMWKVRQEFVANKYGLPPLEDYDQVFGGQKIAEANGILEEAKACLAAGWTVKE